MLLTGEHLKIRGLTHDDLIDRYKWLNDPDITAFFTNIGTTPLSLEGLENWYKSLTNKNNHEFHFSICTISEKHIGGAQFKSIDWKNRNAEFGIFIGDKGEWGKGYATEATALLTDYAFLSLNLHRIWLRVDEANIGAIKCYEKCGFIKEGWFKEETYRNGSYHDSIIMSLIN